MKNRIKPSETAVKPVSKNEALFRKIKILRPAARLEQAKVLQIRKAVRAWHRENAA